MLMIWNSSEMESFRHQAQNALLHVELTAPLDHSHLTQVHAHGLQTQKQPDKIFSTTLAVNAVPCERSFTELKIITVC
jgi:hypothetical protein